MKNETNTTHDWDRLAKMSGVNTVAITLEDGTPSGTVTWNYQRGDNVNCWIVTREDNEGNQVGAGNYWAIRRADLASELKYMAEQTILELDPFHHTRPQEVETKGVRQ